MAAIVFFGKLTRNGWLPRSGTVTRTVEGLGRRGAELISTLTAAACLGSRYGAGRLGALRIERTAFETTLGRRTSLGLTGGNTLRGTGSIAPRLSVLTSGLTTPGLTDGLDSAVGDESESVERASSRPALGGLSSGFSSEAVGFSSEGLASSSFSAPVESPEPATSGGEVCELDSSA